MNLQFHSLAELFAMGGHGVYVWAVYGVAALAAVRSARQRGR